MCHHQIFPCFWFISAGDISSDFDFNIYLITKPRKLDKKLSGFISSMCQSLWFYSRLSASLIISSRDAEGESLRTAVMALFTFGLVNPSNTSAVVASSTAGFEDEENNAGLSLPSPFTTLSLSSRMSLWALFSPIPFILFILFISSERIAFLISSVVSEESIILAVAAPTPDTPIRSLNISRSFFVANP